MATKNVPATTEQSQWLAIMDDDGGLMETMAENLDGGIDVFQLPRIKMPTSASTSWTVPTIDGPASERTIDGVLVYQKTWRTYWAKGIGEGGSAGAPPDCTSKDGKVGTGNPGGLCSKCPMAQWGSNSDGRGQACKQTKALFLLMPGDLLPTLVVAPPTSIRAISDWLALITTKNRKPYWKFKVTLSLEKDRNQDNIEYSKIAIFKTEELADNEVAALASYRESILPYISAMDVITDSEPEAADGQWEPPGDA